MEDIDNIEIKQEFRDDIKNILENIEDEYDDDDITIDDSDVNDFLIEDSMDSSYLTDDNSMESSYDGSSSFNDSSLSEIVPKEEPSDQLENIDSELPTATEESSDFFTSVRSEIMQEIKTEESDNFYSNDATELSQQPESMQYNSQQHQQSHPSQEYNAPELSQQQLPQPYQGYNAPELSQQSSQGYNVPEHSQQHLPQSSQGYNAPDHSQQGQQYPFDAGLDHYPVDGYVKDEYVEDEWKRDIKTENLTENVMYNQNTPPGTFAHNQNKVKNVGTDSWISDNTVPNGWKHKKSLGNNKTFVCAPNGKKFDSRKNALKFMKANHYPSEEIAFMDECLKHEGWKVDEYLPEGWKFKRSKNCGIEYMSSDENIFNSTSSALREIESYYPTDIISAFKMFTQRNSKQRSSAPVTPQSRFVRTQPIRAQAPPPRVKPVVRPEDWTADQTIPVGWRIRNVNGSQILLSPNGLQFGSRRAAFQELVTKNYPDQMKAEMFDKLAFEGYQANELLPFGWIYQKTEEGLVNFLNREGRLLTSFRHAFEFLRTNSEFSTEEVQRFQTFHNMIGPNIAPAPKPVVWNENDQTVPIGWKTRPADNGRQNQKVFLSPDGYEAKSRRLALKHLIDAKFSQESVEEMRRFLYYEGWMDDQSLPYLWKMKRNGGNLLFVSREANILESSHAAIDYIQKNPYSYNQEDIERIEYVCSMVQRPTPVNVGQVRNQVMVRRRSLGQLPPQISVRKVDASYVEDASVPKGWKVKNDGQRVSYMAPNGSTYKSRRTAYQAMIQERYPNEEIELMRKTLKHDGWLDNSELPDGWKLKQMKNNVYLIDRGGELFKSYLEAAKFIETYVQYFTQVDVDKINRLARVNQPPRSSSGNIVASWMDNDSTVPRGWKSKGRAGKGKILMSPDGVVYSSRKNALQLLAKSGATEEQLDEMRMSLVHEGWVKMEVPKHWMYKPLTAYGYHFLAHDGSVLESKGRALEHLLKAGLLTEENKKSIDFLRGCNKSGGISSGISGPKVKRDHAPQQVTPDATWIMGDPSVPEGWRVKTYEHNGKHYKMVLHPSGLSFRNRRTAVSYMSKNNFPPEEIDELRQGLVHDGWREDPMLPVNWRFKSKRPSIMYCTDEGEVIIAHINAIRKLQSSEKYTPQQMEDLKRFVDKHGGTRAEYVTRPSASVAKVFASSGSKDELMGTLKSAGWMENQYLPADWLFKNMKEGNMHINVLSSEGKSFNSYKQAVMFMKSSEKYSMEDIEKFFLFPDGKTRSIRMVEGRVMNDESASSNDWIENDDSVPKGWKSKLWLGSESKKCLLSPEGQIFNSRIGAYKYLLKNGTPEQVQEMRILLGHDGWKDYALLPAGWLYKKKDYNNLYLTDLGEKLSGNKLVLKFCKENEMYAHKFNDLHRFLQEQKTEKFSTSLEESYSKSTRTGHLRWLVESNAEEEKIKKARMDLMDCGWQVNEYLPKDWLHKTRPNHHNINVLAAEGFKFPSFRAAIQFMRTNNNYTESDIQSFRLFPNGKLSSKLENRFAGKEVAPDDPSWKEDDPSVPQGWKSRKMDGKDVTMLQSPSGIVYWSRRSALKDLLKNGASTEEIEAIRNTLTHDGWKTFDNLPSGWMFKRKEPRSVYLTETGELVDGHTKAQKLIADDEKYSAEDLTRMRNFVLEISKTERLSNDRSSYKPSSTKSSLYEMLHEKIRSGTAEEKKRAREELEAKGWWENEYLPKGWMCRNFKSSLQISVLSTEGDIYHSYKSVLQQLASNEKYSIEDSERFKRFPDGKLHKKTEVNHVVGAKHFSLKQYQDALKKENNADEVQNIKEYYLQKGWMEDEALLPSMWLFRQKPGFTSLNFLTASGELLLSTKEANKYLENHRVDIVIDVKKLQAKFEAKFGTNYELELRLIEKKVKKESEPNQLNNSIIKVEKTETLKLEQKYKVGKVESDVSNFKFYSLEEFDNKTNGHIAEFKGVFEQLESFKKTIIPNVKSEPISDLEFDDDEEKRCKIKEEKDLDFDDEDFGFDCKKIFEESKVKTEPSIDLEDDDLEFD